jgi:Flp pilus assembly protein TadG
MKAVSKMWLRARRSAHDMLEDCSAIAATEFAVIVPLMLVMLFGTVEFSSGVAVDRKVTLIARTLSDLTSQAGPSNPNAPYAGVDDNALQNAFTASIAIIQPYAQTPLNLQLSEIYVDTNLVAKIQWSKGAVIGGGATQATLTGSSRSPGDVVTSMVPSALLIKQTYLILSEVKYLYTPLGIGYVMKSNITLSDVAYSRPRQVFCVVYNNLPPLNSGQCPSN